MKRLALALCAALLLAACGAVGSPQTAAQKVFAAGTVYEATAKTALVYLELRRCAESVPQPCSVPAVAEEIKKADAVVYTALIQAKAVVVDPTKTASVADSAVTALQSSLAVFGAVMTQYKIGSM